MTSIIQRFGELNRKASGIVGRFLKRAGGVVAFLAVVLMLGGICNSALKGDPTNTRVVFFLGWKAVAFGALLGLLGDSLAKSDDPQYQLAEQVYREFRKRHRI